MFTYCNFSGAAQSRDATTTDKMVRLAASNMLKNAPERKDGWGRNNREPEKAMNH